MKDVVGGPIQDSANGAHRYATRVRVESLAGVLRDPSISRDAGIGLFLAKIAIRGQDFEPEVRIQSCDQIANRDQLSSALEAWEVVGHGRQYDRSGIQQMRNPVQR